MGKSYSFVIYLCVYFLGWVFDLWICLAGLSVSSGFVDIRLGIDIT